MFKVTPEIKKSLYILENNQVYHLKVEFVKLSLNQSLFGSEDELALYDNFRDQLQIFTENNEVFTIPLLFIKNI